MREIIHKNQNKDDVQLYEKQRDYSSSNDKLFSTIKINRNDYDTIIRRVNEYSYLISCDKLQHKTSYHSKEEAILTDIHTDLIRNQENLVTNEGFIHVKEYALDGYVCRCHEDNHLLIDKMINDTEHLYQGS